MDKREWLKMAKEEKENILITLKEAQKLVLESDGRLEVQTVMLEDHEIFNRLDNEPEIDNWWLGEYVVIDERATFDYDMSEIRTMSEEERKEKVDWENFKKYPEIAYESFIERLEKEF
jgi:hypothetical protein